MRYSGWFDIDGWPLAMLQADRVYLSVTRYADNVAYSEHTTKNGALKRAKRDSGIAVQWEIGRWEPVQ
jgi:hypothetical protein